MLSSSISILYLLCIPILGVSSRGIPIYHNGGATPVTSTESKFTPCSTSSSVEQSKTPHGCGGLGRLSCNKRTAIPITRPSPTELPTQIVTLHAPTHPTTTTTTTGPLLPTESYKGCGGSGRISCNKLRELADSDSDSTAPPTVTISELPIPTDPIILNPPTKGTNTATGPLFTLTLTTVGNHGCGGLGRLSCNKRTVFSSIPSPSSIFSTTSTSTFSTFPSTGTIHPTGCGGLGRISCNKRDAHPHYLQATTPTPTPTPSPSPSTTTSTTLSISFHVPGCGGFGRISCNKRSPLPWHWTTPTTTSTTLSYETPTATATRNPPPPPGCGGLGRLSCNGGDDGDVLHHSPPSYSIVPSPTND